MVVWYQYGFEKIRKYAFRINTHEDYHTIGCYCSHDRQKRKDNNDRCDTNFWCDARRGATSEDLFYA